MRWSYPDAPVRKIIRRIIKKNKGSVLDVGCGPGIEFEGLKKDKIDVNYLGVDVSNKMVKIASELHPDGNFINARVEDLPFEDRKFTTTICNHLLEHVKNYQVAIRELLRVTNKTALLVFFINPDEKPTSRHIGYDNTIYTKYNRTELINFINQLGWKVEEITGIDQPKRKNATETIYILTRKN